MVYKSHSAIYKREVIEMIEDIGEWKIKNGKWKMRSWEYEVGRRDDR